MDKKIASLIILFFLNAVIVCAAGVKPAAKAAQTATPAAAEAGYLSAELSGIENPGVPKAPNTVQTLGQLLMSLFIVLVLFYIAAKLFRYFYIKATIPIKSEGVMKVLARDYIDTNKTIYVVEIADRVIIIGSGGKEHMETLAEITDREAIEKLKQQADEYISRYRLKNETKFDEELKSSYIKQGKKLVDAGNQAIKNIMDKFRKKP